MTLKAHPGLLCLISKFEVIILNRTSPPLMKWTMAVSHIPWLCPWPQPRSQRTQPGLLRFSARSGTRGICRAPPWTTEQSLPFCGSRVVWAHAREGKAGLQRKGSTDQTWRKKQRVQGTPSEKEKWGWNTQLGFWWLFTHCLVPGLHGARAGDLGLGFCEILQCSSNTFPCVLKGS